MVNLVKLVNEVNVVRIENGNSLIELEKITYDDLYNMVSTTKNVCINLIGEIEDSIFECINE